MGLTAGGVVIPRQEWNASLSSAVFEQELFAQLTAVSNGISRLSPADVDIFRDAFQQEALCYANSWLYMLRSTRNDQGGWGYKFVGKDTVMGIGYRNNTLYLVHPTGVGRFDTTLDLCSRIRRGVPYPIILKKIDQELYEHLSATNLFQEPADGSLLEEEAFPEHTLHLQKLYEQGFCADSRSFPLLRKVKRFEKSSMHLLAKTDVSSIESHPGFQALFGPNPDKYRSYLYIIRQASSRKSDDGKYKACAYVDEQGIVHGLYIAERLSGEKNMGLYCAVSSRSHPGITEWMDYDFFRQLHECGTCHLYLGGSETGGVHAYVQKLLPSAPPYVMRPMALWRSE